MMADFTSIHLKEKDKYLQYFHATPRRSIDYTLTNVWGWERYFALHWHFDAALCWIRQDALCPKPVYWAPVGDWQAVDWNTQDMAGKTFYRVPEQLAQLWLSALGYRVRIAEDRGHWEYLYNTQDLVTLSGNRYHKKKNHANAFAKSYPSAVYKPIDASIMEDVLALEDEWCQWHECAGSPALEAENAAVNRVLSHWQYIPGLVGGAIYVDDVLVAFSVGEALDEHTLAVQYEKARNGYRGVYQAMNQSFAREAGEGYALLNRAQDLNEEGLRKAKISYNPVDYLKKYIVVVE